MNGATRASLCLLTTLFSTSAHAHAPLARAVTVSADRAVTLRAPGFGLVVRDDEQAAFKYACDQRFGITAEDETVVALYRTDGALLIASETLSPRIVVANTCAVEAAQGWPQGTGVAAIANDTTNRATFFAVSAETTPRVYRSQDSGSTWQQRSTLDAGEVPATLVLTASTPTRIYISRPASDLHTLLLRSADEGASFTSVDRAADFTLLHVHAGVSQQPDQDQLWAVSERRDSRDFVILRGNFDDATLDETHRVRFFGGFVMDDTRNMIWTADEAGNLFRSDDGGDNFVSIQSAYAIGCLTLRDERLWACSSGTNQQAALITSSDDGAHFDDVIAFGNVTQQLDCGANDPSPNACVAAWREWEADVLERTTTDAGLTDASTSSDAGDDAAIDTPRPRSSGGCSVNETVTPSGNGLALWLGLTWLGVTGLARRRMLARRRIRSDVRTMRRVRTRWSRRAPR